MRIIKSDNDFYTSVLRSLEEIDKDFEKYEGLLIVGSHSQTKENAEKILDQINEARQAHIPVLGICMGMQLMLIEFARNVLHLIDANTTELDLHTTAPIIEKLPHLRVGIRPVDWKGLVTMETHWHNYSLNNEYVELFEKGGWGFSFTDKIAEVASLRDRPFYIGVQFHPEYQSNLENKHPLLVEFIEKCKKYTADMPPLLER